MLPRFVAWVLKYGGQGFDANGEHLFTLQSYKLFRKIMKGIIRWFLSSPWLLQPDGSYKLMDMYYNLPGQYRYSGCAIRRYSGCASHV